MLKVQVTQTDKSKGSPELYPMLRYYEYTILHIYIYLPKTMTRATVMMSTYLLTIHAYCIVMLNVHALISKGENTSVNSF